MDLNMMMRQTAQTGLQAALDQAVTNGDTAEARKISGRIAELAVQSAPKAPPFGPDEIKAEMSKLDWFGVDPKKSGRAIAMGKDMDPKKFASAEAFAAALVKAVEAEFTPPARDKDPEGGEDDNDGEKSEEDDKGKGETAAGEKKPRRTDGPGEADTGVTRTARSSRGLWTKLSDAPAETQKEINRTADKFTKTKEAREIFVRRALEASYNAHQRNAGKK